MHRIGKCAYFIAKVNKEHLHEIGAIEPELATALKNAQRLGFSDTVEVKLAFDYRKKPSTPTMIDYIKKLINQLSLNKAYANLFMVLQTKAQDADNDFRLEVFDFLYY